MGSPLNEERDDSRALASKVVSKIKYVDVAISQCQEIDVRVNLARKPMTNVHRCWNTVYLH